MAMSGMDVAYTGVLLWTLGVWGLMLVCPHHPTLHRILRTPYLILAPHLLLYLLLVFPLLLQGRACAERPSPVCWMIGVTDRTWILGEVGIWGKQQGQRHHQAITASLERMVVGFAADLAGPARHVAFAALNLFAGRWLFHELQQQRVHRALFTMVMLAGFLAMPLGLVLHWAGLIVQQSLNSRK